MPGPVSDSYDPEFGTGSNAQMVRDAIDKVRGDITEKLGPELLNIVEIAQSDEEYGNNLDTAHDMVLTEKELRVIRFCLDRAKESI